MIFKHLWEWVKKPELSAVVNLKCLRSVNDLTQLNDDYCASIQHYSVILGKNRYKVSETVNCINLVKSMICCVV
jgi:hypothetical protein